MLTDKMKNVLKEAISHKSEKHAGTAPVHRDLGLLTPK